MKLTDLLIKENLIIQIVWNEQKIEFPTCVIDKDDMGIFVDPYFHAGKPLELNLNYNSGVLCNVFANSPVDNKRISWRNVEIASVTRNDELLYHIKTSGFNQNARSDDRRKYDRLVIQKKGQLYDSQADAYIDILIHDISDIGISFFAPISYVPKTNQLTILFSDNIDDKYFDLKVDCIISRTQNRAGNSFNGCKIVGENKEYLLYRFLRLITERNKAENAHNANGDIVEAVDDLTEPSREPSEAVGGDEHVEEGTAN